MQKKSKSKTSLRESLRRAASRIPGIGTLVPTPAIERYEQEPIFNSKFFYRELGRENNITLVFCHGTGDLGSDEWEEVLPALEKEYHIFAFDLPGFARSEKKNKLYNPEQYSWFIKWFIDTKTTGPVYLVGYSMGGALSLYFAGTFPGSIERLIIIDAAGILHRAAFTKNALTGQIGKGLSGVHRLILEKPIRMLKKMIHSAVENIDSNMPQDIDDELNSRRFRKILFSGDPVRIAAAALINTDFSGIIEKIRVPTRIIWGENDPVAPVRTGKLLALSIPDSSLAVISGAGHNPMAGSKKAFIHLLKKALDGKKTVPHRKFINLSPTPGKPVIEIRGKRNKIISGQYTAISLKNCVNVTIREAVIGSVIIENSGVTIENSSIASDGNIGITVRRSRVRMTGVSVSGEPAMVLDDSQLDMAGCRLTGKSVSIKSEKESTIVSSVSRVSSAKNRGAIHDIMKLNKGDEY
ncbi:MAG: alpha/beta hydrolase [bacterium]|nr:alpha/beta hydrolase [bacterium]